MKRQLARWLPVGWDNAVAPVIIATRPVKRDGQKTWVVRAVIIGTRLERQPVIFHDERNVNERWCFSLVRREEVGQRKGGIGRRGEGGEGGRREREVVDG